jgi:ABC-type phosphate transport system permease subunit
MIARHWALGAVALLASLSVLPLLLLGGIASGSIGGPVLEQCVIRGKSPFYAVVLPRDAQDRRSGLQRFLYTDGGSGATGLAVSIDSIVSRAPAPHAWIIEREDGPSIVGVPMRVRTPGSDLATTVQPQRHLRDMPEKLRLDRTRLAARIRAAKDDPVAFQDLGESWDLWLARDDATRLDVRLGDGRELSIRLSGIVWVEPGRPKSASESVASALRHLGRFLSMAPGAWGGGGILPALVSVVQLAAFAGVFSGMFGLSAALWIHSWGATTGWRTVARLAVTQLAGIPGVVWGVVGATLLVHGLGGEIDRLWPSEGGTVVWGAGGLLWSSLTLGAFATPIVTSNALDALDRVPARWIESFWACGATEFQIFRRVHLPMAWKGLASAVLSGMARAAGETAPLFLTGAVHSAGGLLLGGAGWFPGFAGGFLHPGVLALDPPWQGYDAELGQPLVALALLCLAFVCIALDLAASWLRREKAPAPEVLP